MLQSTDGGGGGSSDTALTKLESEYVGNAISHIFGGSSAIDIKFDPAGVDQMVKYLTKVRDVDMDLAAQKAQILQNTPDPGHPAGSSYTSSVQFLGDNYMDYHNKLKDAVTKTIETLQNAAKQYATQEENQAAGFNSGVKG